MQLARRPLAPRAAAGAAGSDAQPSTSSSSSQPGDTPASNPKAGAASPPSNAPSSSTTPGGGGRRPRPPPKEELKLPTRGLFAIADTNAEVYSKAGEKFDPAKKGGRYKPEFIWNVKWQEALAREESLQRRVDEARAQPKEQPTGFLSFSRVSELNSLDTDLTDVLVRKQREEAELKAALAAKGPAKAPPKPRTRAAAVAAAAAPGAPNFTRKEVARLGRTTRAAARAAAAVVPVIPELDEERAKVAEAERVRYEEQKLQQALLTVVFTAAGAAMTFSLYTREVAASYLVGALGGFIYLRLLSKSVDGMGASGSLANGLSSLGGQQRLLIPVVLTLVFNRWNYLYASTYGLELELLPILVGFFTYKLALITVQAKEVYDGLGPPAKSGDGQ